MAAHKRPPHGPLNSRFRRSLKWCCWPWSRGSGTLPTILGERGAETGDGQDNRPDGEVEITTPGGAPLGAAGAAVAEAQSEACERFYPRYFDERGYLLCVPRWSGDDGPDDALENVLNWTALHALGADERVLTLYKRALEGHLRQYTEARTTEVELGREGMYYKEFHACFDWFHHGEAWSSVFLQGLADPDDRTLTHRMRRWSSWYMGEDPYGPNYDKEHKVIRSFFNGSRGPLLRKATALDWAGDPIEVAGRFRAGHGEQSFEEMLEHFRDYTDVVGDNPVNLGATTLGLTAFALTGEAKYRDWLLEYLDAWVQRAEQNGGLIPSSVGPDGTHRERLRLVRRRLRLGLLRPPGAPQRQAGPPRLPQPHALRLGQRPAAHRRPALPGMWQGVWRRSTRTPRRRAGRRSTPTCTAGWTGWSAWSGGRP